MSGVTIVLVVEHGEEVPGGLSLHDLVHHVHRMVHSQFTVGEHFSQTDYEVFSELSVED